VACHITQRGVDRRETFSCSEDRLTYLNLLRQNLEDTEVRILAYCLMSNHLHLVAVPAREDSMSVLVRRVHSRYAQYFNSRAGRTGHLWQNRFYGCMLAASHLWTAISYVERNPIRARMVRRAEDYQWSSAVAHLTGGDASGLLDMDWWHRKGIKGWRQWLNRPAAMTEHERSDEEIKKLRACTYAERPFGDVEFVEGMAGHFGRHWNRGRPTHWASLTPGERSLQLRLFGSPQS
jgi:putative transposase